jgi:hypothetical protein
MVAFIRAAWPQSLPKPSSESIVQWAYANERGEHRIHLGYIRRVQARYAAANEQQRNRAASDLEKFAHKHRQVLSVFFRQAKIKT